jgi:hypothetical protein
MPHRVKRTRLALGTLLLGTLLLTPGLVGAAPRAQASPRATLAATSERSLLDRLQDLLGSLAGNRNASGHAGSTLHVMHGSAGCGIDPNGGGPHCTGW